MDSITCQAQVRVYLVHIKSGSEIVHTSKVFRGQKSKFKGTLQTTGLTIRNHANHK